MNNKLVSLGFHSSTDYELFGCGSHVFIKVPCEKACGDEPVELIAIGDYFYSDPITSDFPSHYKLWYDKFECLLPVKIK